MAEPMHVAGLSIPAGSVVRHALEVAELADGSRITLPLLLINDASSSFAPVRRCNQTRSPAASSVCWSRTL